MHYLREDVPGLEVEFHKFLARVEEETIDPGWAIANHPARKILDRVPEGFGGWVRYLEELLWLKRSGYPFAKDDLTLPEWKCLGLIEQYENGNHQYS
jgi:hypothetical protein